MFLSWLHTRILWDADTDTGGTADPPNPDDTTGDGSDKGDGKQSYTQKELDRLFGERTKAAKKTAVAELLKELGVEKADDIKAALQAAKDAEQAQMTELQKAQKEAADNKARIEAVEKEKADIAAAAAEKLLKSAVLVEASKQSFQDPADAWLYIDRSKIQAKEDDTFEGLDKAVEAVLKAKPYLAKDAQRPRIGTPLTAFPMLNGQSKPEPLAPKKVRL